MISFLKRILGIVEFRELAPGESYSSQRFYSIRAVNNTCTFSATTSKGDDLNDVTIKQDSAIQGSFESISVDGASNGAAIIYLN